MTKASVLSSITFWAPGAWTPLSSLYTPQTLSTSDDAAFRGTVHASIERLYDASTQVASILENLAASGTLRIGASSPSAGPAFAVPADPTHGTDSYILFDPQQPVWSISQEGSLFQLDADVILAHELGHTTGLRDPERDASLTLASGNQYRYSTDAFINASHQISPAAGHYAYAPDVISFENSVATQLGIVDHRVSYDAAFTPGDARYLETTSIIADVGSLTGGNHVDIVRYGDQEPTSANNVMDFTGWATTPAVLAFGMTGNDAMIAGGGNAFFYGGVGNDTLTGGAGNDRLYGGTGDDQIVGNGGANFLSGGAGDDHIFVRGSLDTVDGGVGNDVIKIFGPAAGQPAGSSLISFEDGKGIDVVEMQANALTVLDLSKYDLDDVTITAGGKDVYGGGFYQTFYTQFQFLTFTTPGGDRITFTDDLLTVGPSVPSDWSKTGASYAASHIGPLSVQFADGNSLSQAGIWDYVRDFQSHSNVTLDLFGANGGRTYFNAGFSSMSGQAYLAHINSTYFVPDQIV